MSAAFKVSVLVGSLRKESLSRKVAEALIAMQPSMLDCSIVEIGDLPLYNEDLEKGSVPPAWTKFRESLKGSDAVLFITPEYNRSLPGSLKNALDVGSRPSGQSVFAGKSAGVVSQTPASLGAFGANHALRQALVFLDMPVLQQPEMYLGQSKDLFDASGAVKNEDTKKLFNKFLGAFVSWISKTSKDAASRSFERFLEDRKKIALAYTQGDAAPLAGITTLNEPATFFSPGGDVVSGATEVSGRYTRDAASFEPGGSNRLEILNWGASGELAYWSGHQVAEAKLAGKEGAVPMRLRVSENFRLEDGGWKLVHRHGEMAKPAGK